MSNVPEHIMAKILAAKEQRLKKLDLTLVWSVSDDQKLTAVPAEIFELTQLESLNLSGHALTTLPDPITHLSNLTSLDLSRNRLKIVPENLTQLRNLASLDLGGNQLTAIPEWIAQLHNLASLALWGNRISMGSEWIAQLHNLTSLALWDNQLMAVPEWIAQLHNLTSLDLSHNQLTLMPEWIAQLYNLTSLDLSNNQLITVPDSLAQLHNLISLDLGGNRLTAVPEWIAQLHNLTSLALWGNQFTAVPESLAQLHNLTSLALWNNQLTVVPASFGQLHNLTSLDLSNNQLAKVPEWIAQLHNLTSLDLSNNQLAIVPEWIAQLHNLTSLDLSNNQLAIVPASLAQLHNLSSLNLRNNPIETPPLEISVRGIEALRQYFRQVDKEGVDYLYEAKLVIIGEGGAGKTSFAQKIKSLDYLLRDEESTKGIDIIEWDFRMNNDHSFRVNIWDFGGQEIYHATHQYFLTKRTLYALVADTRKDDTDFYYWLNVVELLSDNSPLLIIKNERQDRHREINERQLRGQFTNLKEVLATNLNTNRGLPEILRAIKHYISQLPHIGTPLPRTWVKVRAALEKDLRNYIRLDEYLEICQRNGFAEYENKLQLSGYLHDLGVSLHFQEDPLLRKIVILKPKWGTDAAYKVLDNKMVIRNRGSFSRSDLATIWDEPEYLSMQDELLHLMIKFKLCYQLPGNSDIYIAPQMLTENQPAYIWDDTSNLILRYTYEFMPKGIVTQFIVIMHALILEQKYVWKSGVILVNEQTKAEVIEYYDKREIKVRVAGKHKKELLVIIMYELDRIHSTFRRLKYSKWIPCNCDICIESQDPHFYTFETLRKFTEDRQVYIQCQKSYRMVDVWGLIDDVIDRKKFLEDEARKIGDVTFAGSVGQVVLQQMNHGNQEVYQLQNGGESMAKRVQPQLLIKSAWANGSFYLFVFVVVIGGLGVLANNVPWYGLALILVAGILFVPLIGALQLRQDDRLKEKSFMELVALVIGQLPLIGKLGKQSKP